MKIIEAYKQKHAGENSTPNDHKAERNITRINSTKLTKISNLTVDFLTSLVWV